MSSSKKEKRLKDALFLAGLTFISVGLILMVVIFLPVIKEEAKYTLKVDNKQSEIAPVNKSFSIVIPKIGANAPVIQNVNPYDSKEYQLALSKGVAHAAGSAFPGRTGNVFIFAHSSTDWYIANRYNSVFYLLHRLEKKDKIDVYFHDKKYTYEVNEKKYVDPYDISYLAPPLNDSPSLTLMTCWPPGTTLKRLIIVAKKLQ